MFLVESDERTGNLENARIGKGKEFLVFYRKVKIGEDDIDRLPRGAIADQEDMVPLISDIS